MAGADTTAAATALRPQIDESSTLLVHPITREVYLVPQTSIVVDSKSTVELSHGSFTHLVGGNNVNIEHILAARGNDNNPTQPTGTFSIEEISVVKLKPTEFQYQPMTWASRIEVPVLTSSVNRPGINCVSITGRRFLILWGVQKAHITFNTRACDISMQHLVDEFEPASTYLPAVAGAGLGPDDIPGCVPVPPHMLTAPERIFVAMMNPVVSSHPPRSSSDRWADNVTDEYKRRFEQVIAADLSNENNAPADADPVDWCDYDEGAPRKRVDIFDNELKSLEASCLSPCTPPPPRVDLSEIEKKSPERLSDVAIGTWTSSRFRSIQRWSQKEPVLDYQTQKQAMIWSGLPTDLQTLIFAHMVMQPLIHGTHAETRRAHSTVRQLCHGGLCLADNLIDTQLSRLWWDVSDLLRTNPKDHTPMPSPAVAGARARALGIICTDITHTDSLCETPVWGENGQNKYKEGSKNAWQTYATPCRRGIPRRRDYFKKRLQREATHGRRTHWATRGMRSAIDGTNVAVLHGIRLQLMNLNPSYYAFGNASPLSDSGGVRCSSASDALALLCDPARVMLLESGVA
jgi:hypothetical protein